MLRKAWYIISEGFRYSASVLWNNKLRSMLSVLGISIGIFCIILVLSMVSSLKYDIKSSLNSFGTDVVFVEKWPWDNMGPEYPWWKYLSRKPVSYSDMEFIKENGNKSVVGDCAFSFSIGSALLENRTLQAKNVQTFAISHDYNQIQSLDIEFGRYFTPSESDAGNAVCIIGNSLAEKLFPEGDAVGKTFKLNKLSVVVCAVLKRQGAGLIDNSNDDRAFIPFNYGRMHAKVNTETANPRIQIKAVTGVPIDNLMEEIRGVMRSSRRIQPEKEEDFAVNKMSMFMGFIDGIFGTLNTVGWVIGLFSLMVGAFGVANIMFVSVKERTAHIGIQKALGATKAFILGQFLIESIILCIIGGLFGLLLVYLSILGGNSILEHQMESAMRLRLDINNVIIGLSISIVMGVLAGFFPAYSASKLNPSEAMRAK